METLLWSLGIIVSIETALVSFIASRLWSHITDCRNVAEKVAGLSTNVSLLKEDVSVNRSLSEKVAAMDRDVERMKQDIGTHDSGMRGAIHRCTQSCQSIENRLGVLEKTC